MVTHDCLADEENSKLPIGLVLVTYQERELKGVHCLFRIRANRRTMVRFLEHNAIGETFA